jgi:hypothetical protein
MTKIKNTGILLTEADCFMHTLEERHINKSGMSTNICHYLLELEGKFNADTFIPKINANADILWLASLAPYKSLPLSLPVWRKKKDIKEIKIYKHESDELIPEVIINRGMHEDEAHICFDIVYRSEGNTALIFSWHHLLMDGYGVVLLLKQLTDKADAPLHHIVNDKAKAGLSFHHLANATRAKFFVDRISRKPLTSIDPPESINNRRQKVRIIKFTVEESTSIDKRGPKLGAQFGRSPVYLASAARGVKQLLEGKDISINDFWIPVPKDKRLKGAEGPLLGNHLSFLFYRLKVSDLNSLKATVGSVNQQMRDQIKSGISNDYDILMKFLRRTPTPLYYYWIKGPQGGSLASFLFTVAADHPDDFLKFEGHAIKDAWSFPSGIYPPGLSFAFMRFRNHLHIMINYFEEVISEKEIDSLETHMRKDLLSD